MRVILIHQDSRNVLYEFVEMYIVEDLILSVDHAFNLAAGKYELRNSLYKKMLQWICQKICLWFPGKICVSISIQITIKVHIFKKKKCKIGLFVTTPSNSLKGSNIWELWLNKKEACYEHIEQPAQSPEQAHSSKGVINFNLSRQKPFPTFFGGRQIYF